MAAKRRSEGAEGHHLNWLLAILVIAIILALLVPGASAQWYRREITINNGGGSTLTDYQVLVTLGSGDYAHMDSNGDSIRFTNTGNSIKYDYWIEDWNDGGTSKIWVEVPSVTTGDSTMYMWSKESGESSESKGTATFSFFDDFDNLGNWEEKLFYSWGKDHATISAIGGNLRVVSTGDNRAGPTTTAAKLSQGQRTEAKMVTRTGKAETNQLLYLSKGNTYENDCYTTYPKDNIYAVWRAHEGTADERWNGGGGSGDEVTSYPYIEYRNGHVHFGTRENGEVYSENSPWTSANFKLAFYCYSAGTIEIDWVFVRKYDGTELTITQIGAASSTGEDPVPELPTLILFSVGLLVLVGYILLRNRH